MTSDPVAAMTTTRRLALQLALAEGEALEQAAEALGRLEPAEEEALGALLLEQRLAPLVAHRLGELGAAARPSPGLQDLLEGETGAWKETARRQRLVHLQTSRALAAAGIEAVALKGADLAWTLYPRPWLRPQRDLDLLVPETRLVHAFEQLEGLGCRLEDCSRHPGAMGFWWHHHCSVIHPLGVKLELHRALWRAPVDSWPEDFSLRADFCPHGCRFEEAYLRREGDLLFLAPPYLHLHCLVHHLIGHLTNVGPLGLHDLKLLRNHAEANAGLASECRRIGAPGLPDLAGALLAWAAGTIPEPPYAGAEELLFMNRLELFALQMEQRPPGRLLALWWAVHRRRYRWSEAAAMQPVLSAAAKAMLLLPGVALQPGARALLWKTLRRSLHGVRPPRPEQPLEDGVSQQQRSAAGALERWIRAGG
jgi:hypothetical protein